jgi:hypothetical protein
MAESEMERERAAREKAESEARAPDAKVVELMKQLKLST